ncbi:hypothetical protein FHX82_002104 [Amycolatopsis bartoniae]|uniref:Uncharacterized protein n=1 Tax=Amycolatopsis bartoniae TaxID=941986 RepID=A0A8H9IXH7_9PSEU|nr:hypothetical protein [Amycolatopsis bartoniae]GHF74231.1 hypothetical protein GCM10017566_55020 [Amycolatopsis bartoniae]
MAVAQLVAYPVAVYLGAALLGPSRHSPTRWIDALSSGAGALIACVVLFGLAALVNRYGDRD